jgi:hypothetical protein
LIPRHFEDVSEVHELLRQASLSISVVGVTSQLLPKLKPNNVSGPAGRAGKLTGRVRVSTGESKEKTGNVVTTRSSLDIVIAILVD